MSITDSLPIPDAGPRHRIRPWMAVCAALFAVAWGGNEFTPLLVMYRQEDEMTPLVLDVLLGAYVLGIVPALILGGPLSDRFGRRPFFLPAPLVAVAGSVLLALGASSPTVLFAGRVLSGVALGLVMAVGTAWVKELSQAPFDTGAREGSGAGRAALALTAGFALGAGVAAALAQFGPAPQQSPYFVHIVLAIASFSLLWRVPESRRTSDDGRPLLEDLKIPSAVHRRFLFVVVPMAPSGFRHSGQCLRDTAWPDDVEGSGLGDRDERAPVCDRTRMAASARSGLRAASMTPARPAVSAWRSQSPSWGWCWRPSRSVSTRWRGSSSPLPRSGLRMDSCSLVVSARSSVSPAPTISRGSRPCTTR